MHQPRWVPQREAAFALSTSERTLSRMRNDGTLVQGICWRGKVPHNRNSHILYDLEKCIDELSGQARAAQLETDLQQINEKKEVYP